MFFYRKFLSFTSLNFSNFYKLSYLSRSSLLPTKTIKQLSMFFTKLIHCGTELNDSFPVINIIYTANIVDYKDDRRASNVSRYKAFVTLLTCCIPDLEI